MRKVWSTLAGTCLGYYVYGLIFTFNLIFILGNYLIMAFASSRTLTMKLMIGFSVVMVLMAQIYHFKIKEMMHGFDIDLVFQINFCKFHMLAINYRNAEKLFNPKTRD